MCFVFCFLVGHWFCLYVALDQYCLYTLIANTFLRLVWNYNSHQIVLCDKVRVFVYGSLDMFDMFKCFHVSSICLIFCWFWHHIHTVTQLEFAEGWCLDHVRKDILQYIISELGSLERMDAQIRALMAEMLMRNLANVERATGSLVDRLGQGSATVVALNEERFESHVASGTRQIVSI